MKSCTIVFRLSLLLSFMAVISISIAGDKPMPPDSPLAIAQLPDFQISRGEVLFRRYCVFCHGESGRGDGLNSSLLPVSPRDLGDSVFLDSISDAELRNAILKGGKETGISPAMPPFGRTIDSTEADILAGHIRTDLVHSADQVKEEHVEPEL